MKQREKLMRYVYDAYYNKALNEVLGIKNKSTAIVQIFDVTQYAIFKAFASVTEANKDKKGNPITASKKKKIFAYVQKLNIPNTQKAPAPEYGGYTINDGELKGFFCNIRQTSRNKLHKRKFAKF